MLRSLYDHGADVPASNLSVRGLRAAFRDAAGTLWIDVLDPSAAEERALAQAMAAAPGHTDLELWSPGSTGTAGAELRVALGSNFVVTRRRQTMPWLDDLWTRGAADAAVVTGGGLALAATLFQSALGTFMALLDQGSADLARLEDRGPGAGAAGDELYELRRRLAMVGAGLEPLIQVADHLAASELPPLAKPPRAAFAAARKDLAAMARRWALLEDRAALLARSGAMAQLERLVSSFRLWALAMAVAVLLVAAAVAAAAMAITRLP